MKYKNLTIEHKHRESFLPGQTTIKQKNALVCLQVCGNLNCNEHYQTNKQDYPLFLFYYVSKGKSYLNYMGAKYTLKQGQAFMIDCIPHQVYGANKYDPCSILYAHFEGGASRYYYEKIVECKGVVFDGFDAEIIRIGINKLISGTKSISKYKVEELSGIATNMLNDLITQNATDDMGFDNVIKFARNSITNNEVLSVVDLAKQMGYSKFYFTKIFTKHYGISPYEFISKEKIELCKSKLINTNQSIGDIAIEYGFFDSSHFNNCFKKRERITPLKFRREWKRKQV